MTYLQTSHINEVNNIEIKQEGVGKDWVLGRYDTFPHTAVFMYPRTGNLIRAEYFEICPRNWDVAS